MTSANELSSVAWRELSIAADETVRIDDEVLDSKLGSPFDAAIKMFADAAKEVGNPILVHSRDEATDTASWFTVDSDGKMATADAPAAALDSEDQETLVATIPEAKPEAKAPVVEPESGNTVTQPATRRERRSFLTQEQSEEPASQGLRGFMTRLGVRMEPSENERQERRDSYLVSKHWPGPRMIAVVNGKGGANKTPTTILLSAIFARYGGAGVLFWDNNQTRGTASWRTEKADHDATVLDLLPQIQRLLSVEANSSDLAHYVHHQTKDKYDVLRSNPELLSSQQLITPEDIDAVNALAKKYYRLTFIDTGNNESDPAWLRAIEHIDQLVVATTTLEDRAEAGSLLLDALYKRGGKYAELAENAVVIVSQDNKDLPSTELRGVAEQFKVQAREVVTIPYDRGMIKGQLPFDALQATTQRAWLRAGAAVAQGL